MSIFEVKDGSKPYEKAAIAGNEDSVKSLVVAYIDSYIQGETDIEKEDWQKANLNKFNNDLHGVVDYIQSNLPKGVERVDGDTVQPIIKIVIDEKKSAIPCRDSGGTIYDPETHMMDENGIAVPIPEPEPVEEI